MADTFDKDSILDSIKQLLGVHHEYDAFDAVITVHINSVFATLNQLGVGPSAGYEITGRANKWSEFLLGDVSLNSTKSYVYAKVRLLFDPPTSGFGTTSLENICKDYEWRLQVAGES